MSERGSSVEQRPAASSRGRKLDNDGDPLAAHSHSPSDLKELLAVERTGKPFLVFRDQDGRLGFFAPGKGGRALTVGRRPQTDLPIAWDAEVSGVHAELQGLGGEWTLVDDGLSRNGTYVNGQRVGGRQRLRDGDRIRIGRTILVYKAGTGDAVVRETTTGDANATLELTDTQRNVLIALCRPFQDRGSFAAPASNQQIADELFLSVDAVKMHLSRLFAAFELADVAQNQKRARLAECVLQYGVISERDLH
jgi:FHA domain-containing protein